MGPNVRKLICTKMARDMIPDNVPPGGGLAAGIKAIQSLPGSSIPRDATKWVQAAIEAVKTAPDNPFGEDDEAIAGEILRQIEERRRPHRSR